MLDILVVYMYQVVDAYYSTSESLWKGKMKDIFGANIFLNPCSVFRICISVNFLKTTSACVYVCVCTPTFANLILGE